LPNSPAVEVISHDGQLFQRHPDEARDPAWK
jgi:hypothetical protein